MQIAGKKILEVLKSGTPEERDKLGDMLKEFFAPAFTSTPLNESNLEFYGHFVSGFFRTAVSSIVNSGVDPALISSIDTIYLYYSHFRNHVKANDPVFLPKAFHLLLLNITKTVDYVNYVDHVFKFATYLYNELQLINSEDNIDVFTNPAILWNFAGKLEKQPNFTDFNLSLRVRHMSLRLLALKAKNLPSLVTKLGNTILRFRQQVSALCSNKVHAAYLESAAVWNSIIETVLLAIAKEDKPRTFLLNILELHVHHARFISFYNISQSDSTKNFRNMRSFLDQHIEDDEYTESVFKLCDAILVIGDNSKRTVKSFIASMFDNVKDASTQLAAAVNKDTLTIGQVSLICDTFGIFVEGMSQYELLKEGKLKAGHLKVSVMLLEAHIKTLHSYYHLQQNTAENKEKASRQEVYMCMSYSILMEILYTLFETDDSNKWLLKSLAVAKNYLNDVQSLSETSAKTKEKQIVYISQMLRKFGRFCYNQGHNESGIAVYTLLLEQMKSQDLSEESNEQNYIKAHEYLAECQKRNGDWDGSFKTIINCILIASVSALSTAVKIWLRIKKEAVKDLPDVASKTLKTLIKENQSVVGMAKIDIVALLQLEWQSISSSNFFRKKQKDYAVALLTDLVDLSTDPFAKSRYLYELALILWNIPQPTSKSGKDYLSEAIDLMEPLLKSAQSKDKFLLGQEYLLLYTFEQEEFNQKNFQRQKFLGTHTEPHLEKMKPFTLQTEFAGMEKLDLSLELFEEAVAVAAVGEEEKYNQMTTSDIIALVNSIIFAASIYTASLKPLDAVRALTVAVEVCQSTETSELKLKVLCQICNLLSSLGYPTLAKFLMDTKLDRPQDSTATYSEKISSLVKTLTQAELFAEQGELKKAFELTQEVLCNCILTSSKNKSSCALLGWAKRLLSKLKLMPLHMDAVDSVKSNNEEETPLDLAYEAMRMYTAVIHCIIQPDTPSLSISDFGGVSFDFEKYEIVSEVMKSLLYLSQLYCHVGEEREAKCYIKEGLRLAEIFVLPRWSAAFYLQSVRINFLSGKSLDIIKAKQESKLILLLSNKKEVEDALCPQEVETVCTPENQTIKNLASKFKWSAECSDEESTMKADTVSDHTPLSKRAVSKVVYSPTGMLDLPESPTPHSESCLCQKCQDVLTLELQLKCKMISGEFDYAFGPRPFQENLQSDMEALHLQFSRIIKANLEHTILNKVLHPLVKQRTNGFNVTTDHSIYLRNCCDLARIYLISAQIFEKESEFQIAFNSAKKGLELLSNVNGYSNADLFFLRAGLTLSLANTITCVSDNVNLEELLKTDFDLDCLSSQMSVMSLKPNSQHSPLWSVNNSEANIESCVDKIAALSIEDDPQKGRINEKVKKKQIAEAEIPNVDPVTKTDSMQDALLRSPFPKQIQLHEEKIPVESRVDIQSNVKELSEEGTVAVNAECGPKIKAKGARKTSRASRTSSRACNKVKETLPRGESEIETGRECPRDDAGDDSKIANFDKIIEREIVEEPEEKSVLEERTETSEKLDPINDFAPLCKSLVNSVAIEETELKPGRVKSQASKKVSRNAKVTKTRSRNNTVCDKTDSEIAENILPPILEENKTKSPWEKETNAAKKPSRSTNRKGKNCALKTTANASPSPLANKHVQKKPSESKIFKSRKAVDSNAPEDNQNEEINIYDFDDVDKDLTVKKASKSKRQPAAKTKPTGWQKRLAEASNRIGREIKRGAESPVAKDFSLSPVSLTPDFCLNKSWGCISLSDDDSPASNISGCFSFDELQRGWEPFSEELLNLSSPELLRAAKGSNGSDDGTTTTSREKRVTRRGPARALVSTGDKKGNQGKKVKDHQEECAATHPKQGGSTSTQEVTKRDDFFQSDMRFRCLESAYEQMRLFPPCSLYNFTCKALAMNCLPHDPQTAAFYLTEAQSVTLRHALITQLSRKIRKLIKDQNACENRKKSHLSLQNAPSIENLTEAKQALSFGQKPSNINSLIEAIDAAWTVCQVSVVASPNFSSPPVLIVTQYRQNASPTIVSLPGYSQSGGNEILKLYESIQLANRKSLSLLNKNEWWNARHALNNKLQDVLGQMEQHWLGCWKGILLGHLTNEDDRKKLKMSAEKICDLIKEKCSKQPNVGLIQILIDSSECLSAEELNLAISQVTGLDDVHCKDFISIKSQILQLCKSLNSSVSDRHPLIIILDKVVQHLPWENLPILRNRPVSRMPSLYYLKVQMSYLHHKNSVITDGFDPKSTFYVLNPDDNLPCTQEIFQKSFESTEGWEGVVSKPPTADQFISALTQKDTMIYCGHGNGNKYLHGDYLQQLNCRAVALLMGCSSGQMEAKGILDETGMINNYYLAFCPVIVANLWDVTDRDIDRFLQTLLNNWILSKDEAKISLTEAVVKARTACKLPYLIGCAPVVYGIPL